MGNLKKTAVISFLIMALWGVSMAATVYQVGDTTGWTSMGSVDYQAWAASKNFQVGDTLVFKYNNQFHNVELVRTYQDFETCNASFPQATYTSGFDSIYLERPGYFYFICGFPGHCQMGQRVDISVSPATSRTPSPASSPSKSPTSASSYLYVPKLTFNALAFCLLDLFTRQSFFL